MGRFIYILYFSFILMAVFYFLYTNFSLLWCYKIVTLDARTVLYAIRGVCLSPEWGLDASVTVSQNSTP